MKICEHLAGVLAVVLNYFNTTKGSFTYDVITLGGGGGFQMMTIDDEGEGGVLANDDVITETPNFWDFSGNFSKIFLKIYKIWTKFSTFQ